MLWDIVLFSLTSSWNQWCTKISLHFMFVKSTSCWKEMVAIPISNSKLTFYQSIMLSSPLHVERWWLQFQFQTQNWHISKEIFPNPPPWKTKTKLNKTKTNKQASKQTNKKQMPLGKNRIKSVIKSKQSKQKQALVKYPLKSIMPKV